MPSTNNELKLYDQVTNMVEKSLTDVLKKASATNNNSDLENAISNSKRLLENFLEQTKKDILELRNNSEWDTFTIAFYGETNAGKSTLIETLRILLGDIEKLATQEQFKVLAKDLRIDPQSLTALEKSIQKLEFELTEIQNQANTLKQNTENEEQQKIAQLETLKSTIKQKRKDFSLWQKIAFMFKKLDEEKVLATQEWQLSQLKSDNKSKLEACSSEIIRLSTELNAHHSDRAQVESSFSQLVPLQDGNIIGNGRSDFTLKSHIYRFTANGQKFQLIDVPGIEGDEAQVMSAIESSVKKAHAVFYVTRAATPPGSGSEGQEGTIDKIKRQLGRQTEVWAIYNKSATNPQVLQGDTLINKNDSIGLLEMEKSMIGTLGRETYKGYISVSGMPAFLASASCFAPNNPHIKSREKFLAAMSENEILKRSGMDEFLQFIRTDICHNFQKKIRDANLKKIHGCLQEGIDHLHQARENFANAAKKLEIQVKSASSQIDTLLSGTTQKLKSECHDQLTEMKTSMRARIYNYIDSDQSNDDFKERLTAEIEKLKTSVGKNLEARFAKVFEMFKHEASEIIKKNQKNVDEILRYTIDDPFSTLKLSFNTDFKMENGINMIGLISTLGGAAALVWASFLASNPVGWTTAAVLGAVGLVFSFYKAVRSFFSSDYKKEQQRKSTDENLDQVFTKLTEMLDKNLESASVKIKEALLDAKNQIRIPYEQSVNTKTALEGIAAMMMALRDKIIPQQAVATIVTKAAAVTATAI